MKKFVQIDSIGNLKIDTVLFESYYPILFTCLNEKKELFICVCCQANKNGKKWLLTQTTPQTMIDMLKNKITLRDVFFKFPEVQFTILSNGEKKEIREKDRNDWDYDSSISLPDKGEYMEAEDGEFVDEIQHYELLKMESCEGAEEILNLDKKLQSGKKFDSLDIPKFEIEIHMSAEQNIMLPAGLICRELLEKKIELSFEKIQEMFMSYYESMDVSEKKKVKIEKSDFDYVEVKPIDDDFLAA